ncbi:hypothetical protein Vretimale_14355, partial [Volvox reticuliferus]
MASLFALAGGRNRVNTYSGLPNPRPIAVAMASGSQARQAVPAVGALPDAVDQHMGRLDAVANSGNETTLNRIPSMGVANEPVNVLAAAPPVPATQTPSRRTRDGQPILPIAEQSPSTTHSAAELPRISLPTPALMLDDKLDAKKASARDVDGDDAMEASDGEPPAKRVRAHAPQAAAAAVGAGPSSASRPRQRGKRPSLGGR